MGMRKIDGNAWNQGRNRGNSGNQGENAENNGGNAGNQGDNLGIAVERQWE